MMFDKSRPKQRRRTSAEARRQAILDAAINVFSEQGFAAARLDDVAERAGVAKGTLYLYFESKEALFQALIRGAVAPVLEQAHAAVGQTDAPIRVRLKLFFDLFRREVLGTDRKLILRLIMAEGTRFPQIAEFYHREVVSRGMTLMRQIASRAFERGELSSDAAARFPQLIMAPLLLAVIWDGLFNRYEPLDFEKLLEAHLEVLTGPGRDQ